MPVVSGLVLDCNTGIGIEGVVVSAANASGTVLASGTSALNGYYEINIANLNQQIVYYPYKPGYTGYTRTASYPITPLTLHLQVNNSIPVISGAGSAVLTNSPFTTSMNIRKVLDTPSHIYACTDAGLDIIDLNTYDNVGYILWSGGFTSISLDQRATAVSGVQLGTATSGVLEFKIPDYSALTSRNLFSRLTTKYSTTVGSGVSSNNIICLDRNILGEYLVGTVSGVDFFNALNERVSHVFSSNLSVTACALSDDGDVYYSPTGSGIYVKYAPTANWSVPDYIVQVGGVNPFPILSNIINDIKVTSVSGANLVFTATLSGLLCYQEDRSNLNVSASGAKLFNRFP